jgi:hypothetical protein
MSNVEVVTQELEVQATAIAQRIALIAITDQASLEAAVEDRAEIKRRLARIEELLGPVCDATYKAWKTSVAKRDGLKAPFLEADKAYSRAMGAYEQAQARLRQEAAEREQRERQRLEAEERQRVAKEQQRLLADAEEQRLTEAALAEARGDTETAERLIEAPIPVPVVLARPVFVPVAPAPPKPAAAGLSFRDNYSAKITNLMALVQAVAKGAQPITLVEPNMPALNQMARALKDAMNIPGVEAKNERLAAQKT